MAVEQHPDATWLADDIAELRAWLEIPPRTPTSSITGGGAIAEAESMLSELHESRPTLLVPSASYGMRVALATLGVGTGDSVLIPALDWPSTSAAVKSLGATAIPVPVTPHSLTIDPDAAARARTQNVRAVVACHVHGVRADVPALRDALEGLPIVEDVAQALGATLDDHPVGTLGDAAVFSFGPGKVLRAGEAGAIAFRGHDLHDRALQLSAHPVRQVLAGVDRPTFSEFSIRVHPLAAVLLASRLRRWDPASERARTDALIKELAEIPGVQFLDRLNRGSAAPGPVAVYSKGDFDFTGGGFTSSVSGAQWLTSHRNQADSASLPLCINRAPQPVTRTDERR